ncbi:MAG: ComEC/Rec2 family competence protein [Candidatus Altimarinota bacterium]
MDDRLRVSFLDIGQGDSIFIQTPHGRTVLIDGGPGTTVIEKLGEASSFWTRRIDLMILTHPDRDHLEGLLEVLPRYRIEHLLLTGIVHPSQLYRSFLDMVEAYEIPTFLASTEADWQLDEGVFIDIIAPTTDVSFQEPARPNDTSIMAKLVYGDTTLFLPGDGEVMQEHEILMSDFDLRSEFLKSGHHGSRTSSSLELLRAVQPQQSVIISGRENPFDHPHLDIVLRYDDLGIEWWNTKDEGTITFVSDGMKWRREGTP